MVIGLAVDEFRRIKSMRIVWIAILCAYVFVEHCDAALGGNEHKPSAQMNLSTLNQELRSGQIERIELLANPVLMAVVSAQSESALSREALYRCEITSKQPEFRELVRAVRSMGIIDQAEMPDIRWGILFYGKNNERRSSIYISQDIASAAYLDAKIGGEAASVDKSLIHWLERRVPFDGCVRLHPFWERP